MENQVATRAHYPALDGLRGLACLMVVLYHNFWFLHQYLFFAWVSMDIFFVLSGYLITEILLRSSGKGPYLKNFYARRLLRLLPLYYAALILFILIFPRIPGFPLNLDYYVDRQFYFWTFLQNWVIIFDTHGNRNALNHFWSVAVEEQFYLFWPLVFALFKKPKVLLAGILLVLLGFNAFRIWIWMQQVPDFPYYNFFLFTRADGICVGCAVALMQKINPRFIGKNMALIVLAYAAINYGFYFINQQFNNSLPYLGLVGISTFSMIIGLLVYTIVNDKRSIFSRAFDVTIFKWLGMVSFGTYIFHWQLYLLLEPWLTGVFNPYISGLSSQLIVSSLITLAAYTLGYLSYRYFEMPFLRMKRYFKAP